MVELWATDPGELILLLRTTDPSAVVAQVLALICIEAYAFWRLAETTRTDEIDVQQWDQAVRIVRRFANDTLTTPPEVVTLGQYTDWLDERLAQTLMDNNICIARPQCRE